jgi:Cytochrome c oxidase subunit VII
MKKIQCKGGTQQGESNPTWLKQPSDKMVAGFVAAVAAMGLFRVTVGYYRLATGKGKIE